MTTTMEYRMLSKRELAEKLGYTTRTIDRLVAAKKIPFTRLPAASGKGEKIKFNSADIDMWLASLSNLGNREGVA